MSRASRAVTIDWKGATGAKLGLRRARGMVGLTIEAAVRVCTNLTQDAVRDQVRTHHRVREGVRQRIRGTGASTRGTVYLSGLALLRETGASLHEVHPKVGRALRFADGSFRPRANVYVVPRPFLRHGFQASELDRQAACEKAMELISGAITQSVVSDGGRA